MPVPSDPFPANRRRRIGLIVGPLVYQITTHKARTYAFFDGFVLVGVGGLVLVEVLPETVRSLESLGAVAVPVAFFGFVFPYFLESRLNILPVSPRTVLSTLIVLFLLVILQTALVVVIVLFFARWLLDQWEQLRGL